MGLEQTIRKIAALTLCPHSSSQGIKELDAIINEAAKTVKRWHYIHLIAHFILWLAATLGVATAIVLSLKLPNLGIFDNYGMIGFMVAAAGLCVVFLIWRSLQHGYFYRRVGRFIDDLIPAALQQLIDDFASEERSAWTKNGSVDAGFFESRWAVFLFSKDSEIRDWVRSAKGRKETREIYTTDISVATMASISVNVAVDHSQPISADLSIDDDVQIAVAEALPVVEQITQVAEEAPERTNFIKSDDWIAGGTALQFEAGLALFLESVPSDKEAMLKKIMEAARRELSVRREADSQEQIIKKITQELVDNNLKKLGSSRTTIMNLLHGRYRKADITGYFSSAVAETALLRDQTR